MIRIPIYRTVEFVRRGIPPVVVYTLDKNQGKSKLFAYVVNADPHVEIVRSNNKFVQIVFSGCVGHMHDALTLVCIAVDEQYGFRLELPE